MRIHSQLIGAMAENKGADPGAAVVGLFWINTVDGLLKYDDGSALHQILSNDGAQVITNKDIDGGTASNTLRLTVPKNTKANLDALTRKEGTVVYASDQTSWYGDNGSSLVPLGSGGGGGFNWVLTGASSPLESDVDGIDMLDFDQASNQEVYATIQVPDTYVAGTQIKLIGGAYFCNVNSNNVLFKAQAALLEPATTVLGTYTNVHTSTNTENTQTVSNRMEDIGDIDLTDASGQINAVAVAAGDKIRIRLYRDNTNETVSAAADARLMKQSIAPKFTV